MRIKEKPEDFVVEEITPDGMVLERGKEFEFSDGDGDQLICVLEKRNWDTNRAIKLIAKSLHISRKRIGFAGTKDKRAWTTQRISIWKAKPDDLKALHLGDLWLRPLQYSYERVNLGDLWGNRFTIKISDLSKEEIKQFNLPKTFLVPNFFGFQRFGDKRPVTHLVGKSIVKNDLETAAKTYLAWIGPGESSETKLARKRLSSDWDWEEALIYFPKRLGYELTILNHLAKHPRDYANALRALPRPLLKMFVHAYQSSLFNEYLEKRIAELGLDPMPGDILDSGTPTGPLFGYEMELARGKPGEIEREILENEGIKLSDFRIKSLPEASSKGGRRRILTRVFEYRILEDGEDWVRISFKLEKGCYATTVLDCIKSGKVYGDQVKR